MCTRGYTSAPTHQSAQASTSEALNQHEHRPTTTDPQPQTHTRTEEEHRGTQHGRWGALNVRLRTTCGACEPPPPHVIHHSIHVPRRALERIQPRVVSFEEPVAVIRESLAEVRACVIILSISFILYHCIVLFYSVCGCVTFPHCCSISHGACSLAAHHMVHRTRAT